MKFERYSGYAFSFVNSILYYKLFKKTQSSSTRIFMLGFYFTVLFESLYITGRHIGSFIILKEYLNRYLKYNNGESIISMQAFLFVKTCLIEEEINKTNNENINFKINNNENNNSIKSNKAFLFDQIFGGIYGRWIKRLGLKN